nr:hypothetical protein Aca09nite_89490 [Actinoplanes campanulatus]
MAGSEADRGQAAVGSIDGIVIVMLSFIVATSLSMTLHSWLETPASEPLAKTCPEAMPALHGRANELTH